MSIELVKDTIVVADDEAVFMYAQATQKVAKVRQLTPDIRGRLVREGFFNDVPPAVLDHTSRCHQGLMLLLGKDCPFACRYCYAGDECEEHKKLFMSPDLADRAVSAYMGANPSHPRVNLFGGGEPTRNQPAIQRVINKFGRGIDWKLTTSGAIPQWFLRWLIERDVGITVSVDGPPSIQNYLRPLRGGYPSSPIVERTLRILKETYKGILGVRTTVTKETAPRLLEILDYFHSLGVESIHLEGVYSLGRAVSGCPVNLTPLDLSDKVSLVVTALDWAVKNDSLIKIGSLSHLFSPCVASYCGALSGHTVIVNHLGQLTACSEVVDSECKGWEVFHVGDLGQDNEFHWQMEKFLALRNRLVTRMPLCKTCFARYICRGGCGHKAWAITDDVFSPDPSHCDFIKAIIPLLIKRMVYQYPTQGGDHVG